MILCPQQWGHLLIKDNTMPLIKGAKPGSPGFKKNIETEVKIGKKPVNQAVAIAYSEAKEPKKRKKK